MHCVRCFLASYQLSLKWGATKLTKSTQMYQSSACHFCLVYPESFITSVIYFYWVPYPGRRQWEAHRETIKSDAVVSSSLAARGTERDAISDLCRFAELALFRFVAYVITEKNCASIPFKRRSNMSHFLFGWNLLLFDLCFLTIVCLLHSSFSPFRFQCHWMIWVILS